jgi:hypothetical protein
MFGGGFFFGASASKTAAADASPDQTESQNASSSSSSSLLSDKPAYATSKAHHTGRGSYVNPWSSATAKGWLPQSFAIPIAFSQEVHPSVKRKTRAAFG